MNIHFPGLKKWVLPELDSTYAPKPKTIYTNRDLLELFDTSTTLNARRVAMRMRINDAEQTYNFENLQELASRAGCFLVGEGVVEGDRVMLLSRNRPEWAMSYFGVLKASATVVPIAHESTLAETVNIARASGAMGVVVDDGLLEDLGGADAVNKAIADAGLSTRVWPLSTVFALKPLEEEQELAAKLSKKRPADSLASIIFTSGTTGKPKGVMLTHRNLAFMVAELVRVFELGTSDGMLSVLPLHHTFEFTAGLLVPLSRGAQITYTAELSGETIGKALKAGHVTAIVGVPALWELLRRRVLQRFSEKGGPVDTVFRALIEGNYRLRSKTGIDLGLLTFFPVHEGFGGRIRYLISGGSSLPKEVMKTFSGLGFNMYEGYGLTETSPVLTVSTPKGGMVEGSVGKALSGVEIKIENPDASGVGEVVARGRNVMAGYWENQDATDAVIKDGWFHTGDLGRLDEDDNLFIVGRSKDIIVDANGKNVYPDEIEDLYSDSPWVKELSVVGLADDKGEHVACAVVPNMSHEPSLSRTDVETRVREHFREVSSTLPFWRRVKTLEFWDGDLPRTSSRKVKRRDVTTELEKRQAKQGAANDGNKAGGKSLQKGADQGANWFLDIVAKVADRSADTLSLGMTVEQAGFDSLMYTELGAALEREGMDLPEDLDFTGAHDLAALYEMVRRAAKGKTLAKGAGKSGAKAKTTELDADQDIHVPKFVTYLGRQGLSAGQKLFYGKYLGLEAKGENHIPVHTNFIVAANHTSHLDMGAIKVALGENGRHITSLAAADYFFSDKWRRAYFANFTNLVPMERSGSIRKSLDMAERVLRRGKSMVLFPEGTRARDGEMSDFLPSLGYLARRSTTGILPAYVTGTYDALPVGAAVPKPKDVKVKFGPFLSVDFMDELTAGVSQQEAWRLVSSLAQRIVEALREGIPFTFVWPTSRPVGMGKSSRTSTAKPED